ncbi:MAG TPA: LytTR family transcriptional regulator DNA-binding domain-containing protein [Bacteroidia bacterium]|nr:LytTR family transcriptional regulator DNA-binding domain-containing protein [Bacteroidia bacterium]
MRKISIKEQKRTRLVETQKISWFQADGNNTKVVLSDGTKIISTKILKHFCDHLQGRGFYRIHDKYLINLKHVESYSRGKKIEVKMICDTPTQLPVAVRKKSGFLKSTSEK